MKKMFAMLLAACVLTGLASCSDSKGDAPIDTASLVGLWEVTAEYDDEDGIWDYEFGEQYGFVLVMEFRSDGTGYAQLTDGSSVERNDFDCSVEGNTITVVDGDGEVVTYRIDKLTGTELVLADTYAWEGKTYTDYQILKRIR